VRHDAAPKRLPHGCARHGGAHIDVDIAERLGFERPRVIRELIARNLKEIESFGRAPCRTAHIEVPMPNGGSRREDVTEYWLTEEQALLVSVLSKAPNAPAVRAMLIRVFVGRPRPCE
jgi:hypothetical protein